MYKKFKSFIENEQFFIIFLLISIATASFFLGRASVLEKARYTDFGVESTAISITSNSFGPASVATAPALITPGDNVGGAGAQAGQYVVSKSGTKYHHVSCPGAKQIKEANKIFFETTIAAEAAGYSRAANCDR